MRTAARLGRFLSLASWAYLVWLLLTWTRTAEQLLVGAGVAIAVAAALAPLGAVARPWSSLAPRRLAALVALGVTTAVRVVRADLGLARRILSPRRPLRSGMTVVPTRAGADGELAAIGLLTSLVVDNQIVDLDRQSGELQYHALAVPASDPAAARRAVTEPVERFLPAITGMERERDG